MNEIRPLITQMSTSDLENLAIDYENWIGQGGSYQSLFELAKSFNKVHINHYMMWIAVEVYRELHNREIMSVSSSGKALA